MTQNPVLSIVFSCLIIGLLLYMIKGWFDGVKEELKSIHALIASLFKRAEDDRISVKDCQLKAKETFATIKDLKALEDRVSSLERSE